MSAGCAVRKLDLTATCLAVQGVQRRPRRGRRVSIYIHAKSDGRLKRLSRTLLARRWRHLLLKHRPAMRPPAVAMFADPVEERALKTDVVAESLGFQPLVAQNLFPFGEEFLIKRRLLNEFARSS